MFEGLSHKMVAAAISGGAIKGEDEELYLFSYQSMLANIANKATFLVLGLTFGCFWETLVFLALFSPIRIYAGGFHERSYHRCYLCSTAIFILTLTCGSVWANVIPLFILGAAYAVSAAIIFILAPQEDSNKPLDAVETRKYRRIARTILAAETIIFAAISLSAPSSRFPFFACSAISVEAILLILSYLAKRKR